MRRVWPALAADSSAPLRTGLVTAMDDAAARRERLYFERLLHGVDVSLPASAKAPLDVMRFKIASQMRNYSYLIGTVPS